MYVRLALRQALIRQLCPVYWEQSKQLHSELAAFISQRTLGTVCLPPDLIAALEGVPPAGGEISARALRRHGQRLVAELRENSRSTARGGRLNLSAAAVESMPVKLTHRKVSYTVSLLLQHLFGQLCAMSYLTKTETHT